MYFVVIMAFAFVLSDGMPPAQLNLLSAWPVGGPLAVAVGQIVLIALAVQIGRSRTLRQLDGTEMGHEHAINTLTRTHQVLLGLVTVGLVGLMICTPWSPLVRETWQLARWPFAAEAVMLAPFLACVAVAWMVLYPAEIRIRQSALAVEHPCVELPNVELPNVAQPPSAVEQWTRPHVAQPPSAVSWPPSSPGPHVPSPEASLGGYLFDKFRHQILIIAAPMMLIVLAKFFTDRSRPALTRLTHLPWISDSILGCVSVFVLLVSPVILRYVWATQPLPEGPLRDRFVRICRRIGLRYREILLWHTHGLAVNAAVMGFIPSLRYILVSDALLHTMNDEEIEAVFGHEAGHVHHWHLPFFGLFALVSMYLAGGVLQALWLTGWVRDISILNLVALAVLLSCWLFGFGWLSRRFERQADLFGVRCITPDVSDCPTWCPVHGHTSSNPKPQTSSLCISAAGIFGRTLLKIADLNGIPRHAPSWRHGSIDSRCRLIERFVVNPTALRRFDRALVLLKAPLITFGLVGSAVAVYLYYPSVAAALGWDATRPA